MKVHSFESMGTLDGDGIRYCIFLMGCPLRCVYCHNPDTWECMGTEYSTEDLFKKISRYKAYFGKKGGVTFSGGEPLLSASDINKLADLLLDSGIKYALDTSGCTELTEEVLKVIERAELIICDLKFPDNYGYEKYTGKKNGFETVINFLDLCKNLKKRLWIRTVIIPGINNSKEYIDKYTETVKKYTPERYELLGFHTMGFFKYSEMKIKNPLEKTEDLNEKELELLQKYADDNLK